MECHTDIGHWFTTLFHFYNIPSLSFSSFFSVTRTERGVLSDAIVVNVINLFYCSYGSSYEMETKMYFFDMTDDYDRYIIE